MISACFTLFQISSDRVPREISDQVKLFQIISDNFKSFQIQFGSFHIISVFSRSLRRSFQIMSGIAAHFQISYSDQLRSRAARNVRSSQIISDHFRSFQIIAIHFSWFSCFLISSFPIMSDKFQYFQICSVSLDGILVAAQVPPCGDLRFPAKRVTDADMVALLNSNVPEAVAGLRAQAAAI